MNPSNHLVIIGTGISALTTARLLLTTLPPLPLHITLLDKAAKPGGRIASRLYDSGVILETGARVFESPLSPSSTPASLGGAHGSGKEVAFEEEVERWRNAGFVREVEEGRRKGLMGKGKWWEGVGGFTDGLTKGLMKEVEEAGKGRLSIHFNVETMNPTPVNVNGPIQLTYKTPLTSPTLPPISFLINTAPSPQVEVLLPPSTLTAPVTQYVKTFTLLLPTLIVPEEYTTVYHRDPHELLTSIATGLSSSISLKPAGFIIQSTPEKLGLGYTKEESSDEVVRKAFFDILKESNLLPRDLIDKAELLKGRESQVKRWKFSQVEKAIGIQDRVDVSEGEDEIFILGEAGRIVLAGDGTASGTGGVYGAWKAGTRAAEEVKKWLEISARL